MDTGDPSLARDVNGDRRIVVAVTTYKRFELLDKLLAAYTKLNRPPGFDVTLIVVDNDAEQTARSVVDRNAGSLGDFRYFCEPRRGIPFVRNRALDEALALRADALCFIDDDEYPDPEWLMRLAAYWVSSGTHLIGGPVEVVPTAKDASRWQWLINESLAARLRRKNLIAKNKAACGGRNTIVTSNWLCDLEWQRQSGIRFNEALPTTGGSDTAFYRAASAANANLGWCPDAIVYETITPDRLSFFYQFMRAAAQSNTHFMMRFPTVPAIRAATTLLHSNIRLVLGLALLVFPIFGLASPVMGIRSMGWAVGRFQALRGARLELYK